MFIPAFGSAISCGSLLSSDLIADYVSGLGVFMGVIPHMIGMAFQKCAAPIMTVTGTLYVLNGVEVN